MAVGAGARGDELPVRPPPVRSAPAWLIAPQLPQPSPRKPSYVEQRSTRVERHILLFHSGFTLDAMRERDTLQLYGQTPGTTTATVLGVGVFSGVVVGVAHTPPFLRFAFDRELHLGPAIFDSGMGAGFGGRL